MERSGPAQSVLSVARVLAVGDAGYAMGHGIRLLSPQSTGTSPCRDVIVQRARGRIT